jgi:flagellar motor switch/type III secretory pathway protein FliN
MERGNTDAPLPMVVRRTTGPVEVLVNGRTIALEP